MLYSHLATHTHRRYTASTQPHTNAFHFSITFILVCLIPNNFYNIFVLRTLICNIYYGCSHVVDNNKRNKKRNDVIFSLFCVINVYTNRTRFVCIREVYRQIISALCRGYTCFGAILCVFFFVALLCSFFYQLNQNKTN